MELGPTRPGGLGRTLQAASAGRVEHLVLGQGAIETVALHEVAANLTRQLQHMRCDDTIDHEVVVLTGGGSGPPPHPLDRLKRDAVGPEPGSARSPRASSE
jgi:hypothetical protein